MRLALFFTTGISLETWSKNGNLQRELSLYRLLSKDLEKIFLFTYGSKSDLKFQDELPTNIIIQYKRWPIPNKLYSFLLPFLYGHILRTIDIYKTNQMSGSWTAVIAKLLYGKKLITRCGYELLKLLSTQKHSFIKIFLVRLAEKIAYGAADSIILTSETDQDFVSRNFPEIKNNIKLIPNFVDTELFKPLTEIKKIKRVIYIGRLHEEKNLLNLVRACKEIPIELVMVGTGPLRSKLETVAKENAVTLTFLNTIQNSRLPEELAKSEVFILPSLHEGSPKALLEAMACGMPCIGTPVPGITNIIQHNENGYLCKDTSTESLKEGLLTVLSDHQLQTRLGAKARETIIQHYSLPQIFTQEWTLYKSLYAKT